eukprot:6355910-Prymnesium_polylepis.1
MAQDAQLTSREFNDEKRMPFTQQKYFDRRHLAGEEADVSLQLAPVVVDVAVVVDGREGGPDELERAERRRVVRQHGVQRRRQRA